MNPGLQKIPQAEYLADPCPVPSLSAGLVDILTRESPLHAWYASPRLNPDYQPEVDSKFDVGTAAHALLFEGDDRMAVIDPADYPSKQGGIPKGWTNNAIRAARDDARAAGRIPVLLEDANAVRAMVGAAREAWEGNSDLQGYALADGMNEWSILWDEIEIDGSAPPSTRLLPRICCRCKPDHLAKDRRLMVDAKFTDTSANPFAFERQIDRMGYDLRAAWYMRGNAATGGPSVEEQIYAFLVCETKPPHACSFIALDPAYLDLGRRKVENAIAIWRSCMASGKWPGYLDRIHYAAPPAYAIAQQEEQEVRGFEADPSILFGDRK